MESQERPTKLRKLSHGSEGASTRDNALLASTDMNGNTTSLSVYRTDAVNPLTEESLRGNRTAYTRSANGDSSRASQNLNHELSKDSVEILGTDNRSENKAHQPSFDATDLENTAKLRPANTASQIADAPPPLSKNQQKKLKRQQEWEAGRDARKALRKEKEKARKEQKRAKAAQAQAAAGDETATANGVSKDQNSNTAPAKAPQDAVTLPVTFLFDCDFDGLMGDGELKSLSSQITRCHSDNRRSKYKAHLAVASFGGRLKERYDGILAEQYKNWKGVRFFSEDFVGVAEKAKEWMEKQPISEIAGALPKPTADTGDEPSAPEGEVVYLTADSDETVTELKPYSTYIIGGLVDKNRHKGICYKRATMKNVKTGKLPIGEYMEMNSRYVLAVNHVNEIMLKWLESGDWGDAFMKVMPKRKGAALKGETIEKKAGRDARRSGKVDGTADEHDDVTEGAEVLEAPEI